MNIAIAINMEFVKYAYFFITSILENNTNVTVYILHNSLTKDAQNEFLSLADRYNQKISFLDVGNTFDSFPIDEKWPVEVYFRLALPYILPESEKKVLYLDTDMVNIKPLGELYDTNFDDKSLAACQDVSSRRLSPKQAELFGDFLNFIAENKDLLSAFDQDAINYMFYGDILDLPSDKYNLYARIYYNSGVRKRNMRSSQHTM